MDNGSCNYCDQVTVNFSVDAGNVVSDDYNIVLANGNWSTYINADGSVGWNSFGVELFDEDGDGIYVGSIELDTNSQYQYVHALTGL